ncbi:MAG: AI-2E family transporter [Spirochaetales bacterium]
MRRTFPILDGFFLLVLLALTLAFFIIIQPFIITMFLTGVVTIVSYRPYRYLLGKTGGRRYVAAAMTLVAAIVVVAVPLTVAAFMVYAEILGGYAYISNNWPELTRQLSEVELLSFVREVPFFAETIGGLDGETLRLNEIVRNALSASSDFLVALTQRSFANIASTLLNFLVFFVLYFFLLVDGERLVRQVRALLPLSTHEVDRISRSATDIIIATLITTFGIGIIEGALGAIYFSLFGLPSPFLWGMVTVIFSIIPMIGANFVMIPAGILLILTGSLVRGLLLIVLSVTTVMVTQNVIRPAILGERSGLHPALVLLSTVGGLGIFGLVGFLVGPLFAALFVVIWTEFGDRFRQELSRRDLGEEGAENQRGDSYASSRPNSRRRRRALRPQPKPSV